MRASSEAGIHFMPGPLHVNRDPAICANCNLHKIRVHIGCVAALHSGLAISKVFGYKWSALVTMSPEVQVSRDHVKLTRKLFVAIFVKDCFAAVRSVAAAAGGSVAVVNHVVGGGGGRQSGVFAFQSTVGQQEAGNTNMVQPNCYNKIYSGGLARCEDWKTKTAISDPALFLPSLGSQCSTGLQRWRTEFYSELT